MKGILLMVCVFGVVFDTACSLNCHRCTSDVSNCISKYTECGDDDNMCFKKVTGKRIEKKCTTLSDCKQQESSCQNTTCEVHCCHEDYCNSSRPLQGTFPFVLLASVLYILSLVW